MTDAEDLEEAPAHLSPEAARAYVDARTQGLCHEGALEVALGVGRSAASAAGRLEAVEFKIAHLERAVRLRQQLEDIEGRTADPTAVEIPPHY